MGLNTDIFASTPGSDHCCSTRNQQDSPGLRSTRLGVHMTTLWGTEAESAGSGRLSVKPATRRSKLVGL